ncbi:MAG: Uma2 family endonuclease, partial [Gemmataceae bacterium]
MSVVRPCLVGKPQASHVAMKIKTPPIHTTQRSGTFTYKDFRALIRDDQKADLIDGVIYVASPENTDANRLFGWLFSLMLDFADLKNLGLVLGSRVACRLDEHHAPEPDILFVRNENLHRVH